MTVALRDGLEPGDMVIVSGNVNLAHETVQSRFEASYLFMRS